MLTWFCGQDITSYVVTSLDPFIVKKAVKGDGKASPEVRHPTIVC